jgi:hypothetical protein
MSKPATALPLGEQETTVQMLLDFCDACEQTPLNKDIAIARGKRLVEQARRLRERGQRLVDLSERFAAFADLALLESLDAIVDDQKNSLMPRKLLDIARQTHEHARRETEGSPNREEQAAHLFLDTFARRAMEFAGSAECRADLRRGPASGPKNFLDTERDDESLSADPVSILLGAVYPALKQENFARVLAYLHSEQALQDFSGEPKPRWRALLEEAQKKGKPLSAMDAQEIAEDLNELSRKHLPNAADLDAVAGQGPDAAYDLRESLGGPGRLTLFATSETVSLSGKALSQARSVDLAIAQWGQGPRDQRLAFWVACTSPFPVKSNKALNNALAADAAARAAAETAIFDRCYLNALMNGVSRATLESPELSPTFTFVAHGGQPPTIQRTAKDVGAVGVNVASTFNFLIEQDNLATASASGLSVDTARVRELIQIEASNCETLVEMAQEYGAHPLRGQAVQSLAAAYPAMTALYAQLAALPTATGSGNDVVQLRSRLQSLCQNTRSALLAADPDFKSFGGIGAESMVGSRAAAFDDAQAGAFVRNLSELFDLRSGVLAQPDVAARQALRSLAGACDDGTLGKAQWVALFEQAELARASAGGLVADALSLALAALSPSAKMDSARADAAPSALRDAAREAASIAAERGDSVLQNQLVRQAEFFNLFALKPLPANWLFDVSPASASAAPAASTRRAMLGA